MPSGVYKRTEENKRRLSVARVGKVPWNKGMSGIYHLPKRILSEETKQKIRETHKRIGIKPPSRKGIKFTDEQKEKMRKSALKRLGIPDKGQKRKPGHQGEDYKKWRLSIYQRDLFTCQVCKLVGGELNAHHIRSWAKYPDLRLDINNGITLCHKCHWNLHRGVSNKKLKINSEYIK